MALAIAIGTREGPTEVSGALSSSGAERRWRAEIEDDDAGGMG